MVNPNTSNPKENKISIYLLHSWILEESKSIYPGGKISVGLMEQVLNIMKRQQIVSFSIYISVLLPGVKFALIESSVSYEKLS